MTGKKRLEMILKGQTPDVPPHFELLFQLEKQIWGIDRKAEENKNYASEAAKKEAMLAFDTEVKHRLIEEFCWSAVTAMCYESYADRVATLPNLKNLWATKH